MFVFLIPVYGFQLAASYLSDKKRYLDLALSFSPTFGDLKLSADDSRSVSVIPSAFVGQFVRFFEHDEEIITQLHVLTLSHFSRFGFYSFIFKF